VLLDPPSERDELRQHVLVERLLLRHRRAYRLLAQAALGRGHDAHALVAGDPIADPARALLDPVRVGHDAALGHARAQAVRGVDHHFVGITGQRIDREQHAGHVGRHHRLDDHAHRRDRFDTQALHVADDAWAEHARVATANRGEQRGDVAHVEHRAVQTGGGGDGEVLAAARGAHGRPDRAGPAQRVERALQLRDEIGRKFGRQDPLARLLQHAGLNVRVGEDLSRAQLPRQHVGEGLGRGLARDRKCSRHRKAGAHERGQIAGLASEVARGARQQSVDGSNEHGRNEKYGESRRSGAAGSRARG
jgi:hypothetical protein